MNNPPTTGPRPRRVLILEDEPLIAMDLEQWLADLGFEVIGPFARNEDALDALGRVEVDFAILDYLLGNATCSLVAEQLTYLKVPHVFLTGCEEPLRPSNYRRATVLRKPICLQHLNAAISRLFTSASERLAV